MLADSKFSEDSIQSKMRVCNSKLFPQLQMRLAISSVEDMFACV